MYIVPYFMKNNCFFFQSPWHPRNKEAFAAGQRPGDRWGERVGDRRSVDWVNSGEPRRLRSYQSAGDERGISARVWDYHPHLREVARLHYLKHKQTNTNKNLKQKQVWMCRRSLIHDIGHKRKAKITRFTFWDLTSTLLSLNCFFVPPCFAV